jgi:hypothetical protein
MDGWNNDLEGLFQAYRQSVPDPEASREFMPKLWERIDSRRNFTLRLKRLSQLFVGTAAVLCCLIAGASIAIPGRPSAEVHATYLDALAAAHPADNLLAAGVTHPEAAEPVR